MDIISQLLGLLFVVFMLVMLYKSIRRKFTEKKVTVKENMIIDIKAVEVTK